MGSVRRDTQSTREPGIPGSALPSERREWRRRCATSILVPGLALACLLVTLSGRFAKGEEETADRARGELVGRVHGLQAGESAEVRWQFRTRDFTRLGEVATARVGSSGQVHMPSMPSSAADVVVTLSLPDSYQAVTPLVLARTPGSPRYDSGTGRVHPLSKPFSITVRRGRTVTCKVRGETGSLVVGASGVVGVWRPRTPLDPGMSKPFALSKDDEGCFALLRGLPLDSPVELYILGTPGTQFVAPPVAVGPTDKTATVTIATGERLGGRIVGEEFGDMSGWLVVALPTNPPSPPMGMPMLQGVCSRDGSFEISGLESGRYDLVCFDSLGQARAVKEALSTGTVAHRVEASSPSEVRGTAEGLVEEQQAEVELWWDKHHIVLGTTTSGYDGKFACEVPALRAAATLVARTSTSVAVHRAPSLASLTKAATQLDLSSGCRVSARISGAGHDPVYVVATCGGWRFGDWVAPGRAFSVDSAPRGNYQLTALSFSEATHHIYAGLGVVARPKGATPRSIQLVCNEGAASGTVTVAK